MFRFADSYIMNTAKHLKNLKETIVGMSKSFVRVHLVIDKLTCEIGSYLN